MKSRIPFYLLVTILIISGLGLSIYRHQIYGVPWFDGQENQVWEVEGRIEFEAKGEPVKISLAIPDTQKGLTLINEHTSSPGYGFTLMNNDDFKLAEWTKRKASGKQVLYFKNQLLVDENAQYQTFPPEGEVTPVVLDAALSTAAELYFAKREIARQIQ